MKFASWSALCAALLAALPAQAADPACLPDGRPQISFIGYASPDISKTPPATLTIKGKLGVPPVFDAARRCFVAATGRPAVLIVHGSSGVDARGDFHEQALHEAGFATLQIDMWEARGVTDLSNRPQVPLYTYPDVFNALAFLSARPEVDPARIGVLGFSWGGVMALGSSEKLYARLFGGGRQFKAHVAHYPVCYGANNADILAAFGVTPALAGTQYLHPTGAPVLIQIGTRDGYDNSAAPCQALAELVNRGSRPLQVAVYPDAYHAWDRLMVPITVTDPFGNQGSYFSTGVLPEVQLVPDPAQAYAARTKLVRFFLRHL